MARVIRFHRDYIQLRRKLVSIGSITCPGHEVASLSGSQFIHFLSLFGRPLILTCMIFTGLPRSLDSFHFHLTSFFIPCFLLAFPSISLSTMLDSPSSIHRFVPQTPRSISCSTLYLPPPLFFPFITSQTDGDDEISNMPDNISFFFSTLCLMLPWKQ